MKYQNIRNGKIAELTQVNDKFGTVDLLYEDGKQTTIQKSTLRRWWKEIPEEETIEDDAAKYVEASQEITKELNKNNSKSLEKLVEEQAEEVASDGTLYSEVMAEIKAGAEAKAKEAKKKGGRKPAKMAAPNMVIADEIIEYLESTGLTIMDNNKWKRGAITIKKDKKTLFAIFPVSKTGTYTVSMKEDFGIKMGVTSPTYNTKMVKFNLPLWAQELDCQATLKLVKKLVKGEK